MSLAAAAALSSGSRWSPPTPARSRRWSPTNLLWSSCWLTAHRCAPRSRTSTTPTTPTGPSRRCGSSWPMPAWVRGLAGLARIRVSRRTGRGGNRPRRSWRGCAPPPSCSSSTCCARRRATGPTSRRCGRHRRASWSPAGPPPRAARQPDGGGTGRPAWDERGRLPRRPRRLFGPAGAVRPRPGPGAHQNDLTGIAAAWSARPPPGRPPGAVRRVAGCRGSLAPAVAGRGAAMVVLEGGQERPERQIEGAPFGGREGVEELRLVADLRADRPVDRCLAVRGQADERPTTVVRIRPPFDQARVGEPVQSLGHPARREHGRAHQLGRGELVGRAGTAERREQVEPAGLQAERAEWGRQERLGELARLADSRALLPAIDAV